MHDVNMTCPLNSFVDEPPCPRRSSLRRTLSLFLLRRPHAGPVDRALTPGATAVLDAVVAIHPSIHRPIHGPIVALQGQRTSELRLRAGPLASPTTCRVRFFLTTFLSCPFFAGGSPPANAVLPLDRVVKEERHRRLGRGPAGACPPVRGIGGLPRPDVGGGERRGMAVSVRRK
jgi:hypothetical protein